MLSEAEYVGLIAGYNFFFFFNGKASAGNIYTVNTMFGVLVTIGKKLFDACEAATREFESFCKPKCFLSIVQYNFHL